MFGIYHSIANNALEESFEDTTSLIIYRSGDALCATTTSESANSGLRDTLNVVAQVFAVALAAKLSKAYSTFTTCRGVLVC